MSHNLISENKSCRLNSVAGILSHFCNLCSVFFSVLYGLCYNNWVSFAATISDLTLLMIVLNMVAYFLKYDVKGTNAFYLIVKRSRIEAFLHVSNGLHLAKLLKCTLFQLPMAVHFLLVYDKDKWKCSFCYVKGFSFKSAQLR